MTVRARYDGKNFVPIDPVDLPKDQIVELEVRREGEQPLRKGSPELILQIMDAPPHVAGEAVTELERAIEAGKVPARQEGIFDDLG